MRVYEFGDFEKPFYKAMLARGVPGSWPNGGGHRNAWCCAFGKGHRTPRAAAQHAARLMTREWEAA